MYVATNIYIYVFDITRQKGTRQNKENKRKKKIIRFKIRVLWDCPDIAVHFQRILKACF